MTTRANLVAWQKALEQRAGDRVDPAEPTWSDDGVPNCTEKCPHHDGKRCGLIGFRAPDICEPVVREMAVQCSKVQP